LQNEYVALRQQILQKNSDLNLLLTTQNIYYRPDLDLSQMEKRDGLSLNLAALIDTAYQNRYDLKSSEANLTLSQQNLSLQKAIAIPDLSLGITYASNGSAAPNYFQLYASIDLPFFNRNQGNIKSSKFQVNQSQVQFQSQKEIVQNDVSLAYNTVLENQKVFKEFNPQFLKDYDQLIEEVLKNYTHRNLGLLEFLDFYDSYKQNVLQANTLQLNRFNAFEQINFVVGKDIF